MYYSTRIILDLLRTYLFFIYTRNFPRKLFFAQDRSASLSPIRLTLQTAQKELKKCIFPSASILNDLYISVGVFPRNRCFSLFFVVFAINPTFERNLRIKEIVLHTFERTLICKMGCCPRKRERFAILLG